jgi:Na+-transporting NADH:ubiquinone oxidoreductase subunit NqrD
MSNKIQMDKSVKNNIDSIILYGLSLTTVLGFSDLILSIFNNFNMTNRIISKTIYVIVIFTITISVAYFFKLPVINE